MKTNVCPEGASIHPAKAGTRYAGSALVRTSMASPSLGPTAQQFSSRGNGWPVGPTTTFLSRPMVQGRPGNAGCPPSLGELTAFGPNENAAPRGMTLVELLVVLAIIMMVAAATIPRLKPEMDRARVREAARSIQLYLSSARDQAMATGRSVGVQIERLPAENGCSMSLTQLETPPLYAGDFTNSVAQAAPYAINPTPPGNLATGLIQIESWNSSSLYAVARI